MNNLNIQVDGKTQAEMDAAMEILEKAKEEIENKFDNTTAECAIIKMNNRILTDIKCRGEDEYFGDLLDALSIRLSHVGVSAIFKYKVEGGM